MLLHAFACMCREARVSATLRTLSQAAGRQALSEAALSHGEATVPTTLQRSERQGEAAGKRRCRDLSREASGIYQEATVSTPLRALREATASHGEATVATTRAVREPIGSVDNFDGAQGSNGKPLGSHGVDNFEGAQAGNGKPRGIHGVDNFERFSKI